MTEKEFINHKLNNMTLKEKIGQMIMIDYRNIKQMTVDLEKILSTYYLGGFVLFRSNINNFQQTEKLLREIKNSGDIPLIISVDQEGGKVQRLHENVGFDRILPMGEISKTYSEEDTFKLGKKIGNELKSIGVDMNMAPILDIFSNTQNKVIADRSFGSNPEIVKKLAMALAKGLREEKIIAIGKHFPGHGDTFQDSHVDLPIVKKDLEELNSLELIPFVEAIKQKIPGIMVGHLALPKITHDNTPASLSHSIISDILKENMGYNGLIMPDSLKMKALTNYYNNEEIYINCIKAGNDIIFMPDNIKEAFNTLYEAVNEGIITEERINESVNKVLSTKFDYDFFNKDCLFQKRVLKKFK